MKIKGIDDGVEQAAKKQPALKQKKIQSSAEYYSIPDYCKDESKIIAFNANNYPVDLQDKVYAFKPRMNADQARKSFLKQLCAYGFVDKGFLDEIKNNQSAVQVECLHFECFYGDVSDFRYSTRRSRTVKDDFVYLTEMTFVGGKCVEERSRITTTDKTRTQNYTSGEVFHQEKLYASLFEKVFYSTKTANEQSLMPVEEVKIVRPKRVQSIIAESVFQEILKDRWASTPTSAGSMYLRQILLFPVWRITVEYQGQDYVNYVSDVNGILGDYYQDISKMNLTYDYAGVNNCFPVKDDERTKKATKGSKLYAFFDDGGVSTVLSVVLSIITLIAFGAVLSGVISNYQAITQKGFSLAIYILLSVGLLSSCVMTFAFKIFSADGKAYLGRKPIRYSELISIKVSKKRQNKFDYISVPRLNLYAYLMTVATLIINFIYSLGFFI